MRSPPRSPWFTFLYEAHFQLSLLPRNRNLLLRAFYYRSVSASEENYRYWAPVLSFHAVPPDLRQTLQHFESVVVIFTGIATGSLGKLYLPLWFQRLYEQCFFFKWICVLSRIEFLQFIIFSFDENLHSFHFCLEKSKYLKTKSITLSWDSFKINIEIPNQTSMI